MTSTIITAAILDGISYGAQLFLVAVGLSFIFGVAKVVNVAHGSFYAIGAYAAVSLGQFLLEAGINPWFVYPALVVSSIFVGAVLGGLIEITLLRRIYGKEEVLQLLVTFAVFMILEDFQKLVWGVQPYFYATPLNLLGQMQILGITYSVYQLVVIPLMAIVVLVGLRMVLRRTRIGRVVVAVTEDKEGATAMGVNAKLVYLGVFIVGASLAAFGGALSAGSTSLVPGMGAGMIILSFAVAATAGLGQIEGAAVAALMIGFGRSVAIYTVPEFDIVVPYLIMFTVLLFKPQGIFTTVKTRKI
ncbi:MULTISPECIES: branched-chain amino acid ABC transporter permease [Agrobacterium]|uniref:Branched-chain amino acid ABC transporter permease n=1 Tax=Agrobacterium rubi TaxID=28099 RepID=A0AAE7UTX3_9HYPH|nr:MULTISPECIES: branched-chain amino acid ABC transporter permease [Agrobacterium]MBN7807860.1 branched-chain amino acid ABC transporter permease [Agrobacterium rosae]NTE89820.1 branched-chain amino acid ABC transporter permease [Agrobacterium rubi]NTF05330.1 branched-chain amino acid ABC transporter permease [Agrobacterium rubi]NTF39774.1 branched-chain amino acid ABC transporter permease [Agrobacterium rubi]OCJ44916.1 ABC transporter permease [Agrobacterium rubi]